jgi:putative SOS response-associated peptidase YedK
LSRATNCGLPRRYSAPAPRTLGISGGRALLICNLYRICASTAEIGALFRSVDSGVGAWKTDIYPRYSAPVVRQEGDRRLLDHMTWGFARQVPGKTRMLTRHVTNARNLSSLFWRSAVSTPARRCLVPFTRFAEPAPGRDADGRPTLHWFSLPGQPIAAFAGLWRAAEEGGFFAFATCEPNSLVAPLHEKAMPVILLPEDWDRWLTGSLEEVLALQAPFLS